MKHGKQCQAALHTWGRANQSSFDSNKESFSIISQSAPEGPSFKLLGVVFDTKLKMEEAVATLSNEMAWKLRNLLRTQRYFDTKSLVHLFKSRILGYVEYRTAAIYHATATSLDRLDRVYSQLLRAAGLTKEEALLYFGLAPLNARRDVAMLGIVHRTVLGRGPKHFEKFFVLANQSSHPTGRLNSKGHEYQLQTYRTGRYLDVVAHSLLGAIDVYNILPAYVVDARDVSEFQNRLQQILKIGAAECHADWTTMLSNRHLMFRHPLLKFHDFCGMACKTKNGAQNDGGVHPVAVVSATATATCINGWLQFGRGIN